MTSAACAALPIVLLPVGVDDEALDACLAALDAATPPGTRVWLADDAQAGPRGYAIIERWIARTALQADYTRRQRSVGEVAHLDEVLAACGDADVAVLAADAAPCAGLAGAAVGRRSPAMARSPPRRRGAMPAKPRPGRASARSTRCRDDLRAPGARRCAAMPALHPELPAAVTHAVLLRGSARRRAGGLDAAATAPGTRR